MLYVCVNYLLFYIIGGSSLGSSINKASPNFFQFWGAITGQNIIKNDKKWSFNDGTSWIGGTKIMYVRDCYVQLANKLLGENVPVETANFAQPTVNPAQAPLKPLDCALILGPKGIGKTMFLNYLIVRIVEKARNTGTFRNLSIVYLYEQYELPSRIRFTAGGCSIITIAEEVDYYLSDSCDIADGTLGKSLLLEVASENESNYKRFSDRLIEKHGKWITMDVWTLDELKQVKPPDWTDIECDFLYAVFGGRVRYFLGGDFDSIAVVDDIEETAQWFFGTSVKNTYPVTWNRALQLIRRTILNAKGKTTKDGFAIQISMFWVANSNSGISGFSSTFLKFVAGRMKEKMEVSLWNELAKLVGGSGQGLWFEALGHMKLTQTEKEYTAKILKKGGRKALKMKFNIPKVLIRTVDDIATLPVGCYGLPVFDNFMLVDAVIKPNVMLQFTVCERHGYADDINKWDNIRQHLGGERKDDKLIFIIPHKNFKLFTFVGVPTDVQCYYMTWEDVANESVTAGIKRKYAVIQDD